MRGMDKHVDIAGMLEEWPYDPEDNVRICDLPSGRTVIQVRLPFGIEQYERDGRPDGKRPHGCESFLDYQMRRLRQAKAKGKEKEFCIESDDCVELFEEGLAYYYRYLHLFELQDWERTLRDTDRNLRLFDFVRAYAEDDEDRVYLEQWRPYIMRVHAVARAMIELKHHRYDAALQIIQRAMRDLDEMPAVEESTYQYEHKRSLSALREMAEQIERAKPLGERERLERDLAKAVEREEFERAAELRDRIQMVEQRHDSGKV